MKKIIGKYFFLLCVMYSVILFPIKGKTQSTNQKLRLAQELENSGQWKEAQNIYETLYSKMPGNIVVFNRLKNLYLRTRSYQKALELVEKQRMVYPNNLSLDIAYAQVIYKMGRHEEAVKEWMNILDQWPKQSSVYRAVANAMIQERLLDKAINVYLLGRRRLNKNDLFTFDLANLYGLRMEYGKATDELLDYLKIHPHHFTLIENMLLTYPRADRVIKKIIHKIKEAIASRPKDAGLRKILVSIYLRAGRYKEGFKAAEELEKLTEKKKQGETLFRFGEETFRAGAPEEAEKAYREILRFYPDFSQIDRVLFGLARCYEAQNKFRQAAETYHQVFTKFSRSQLASQSLYLKGLILENKIFDLSGAIETFRTLIKKFPSSKYSEDARLELGNCFIAFGNLGKAEETFRKLLEKTKKRKGKTWVKALVQLSDVAYLRGDFEEVVALLRKFSTEQLEPDAVQEPLMNNGLELRLFVEEYYKKSPKPLTFLARGEFWERQRKYDMALRVIDSLITKWPDDPITAHALFKKGEIEIKLGKFNQSKAAFETLFKHFPESLLADRALERTGWICEKTGNKKEAVKTYENLLTLYPQSFLADDVRKRINRLKKEVNQ